MGIKEELRRFVRIFRDLGPVLQEQDYLEKKVKQITKKLSFLERGQISSQLKDLSDLLKLEISEKEGLLRGNLQKEKEALLVEYGVGSIVEAKAHILREINRHYNLADTPGAKWLCVQESFLEYQLCNKGELRELQDLANQARELGALNFAEKTVQVCQELLAEEEFLGEMVKGFKPENYMAHGETMDYETRYVFLKQELQHYIGLYQEEGRTGLLVAFKQYLRDCGAEPEEVVAGIRTAERYLEKGEDRNLADLLGLAVQAREAGPPKRERLEPESVKSL